MEPQVQVGMFAEKKKPAYINMFELEFGARMNFIKRLQSHITSSCDDLTQNYLKIINMVKNESLVLDQFDEILEDFDSISQNLTSDIKTEERRKVGKRFVLQNAVPNKVLKILTRGDKQDIQLAHRATEETKKFKESLKRYREKVENENRMFDDRVADIEGGDDINQLHIAQRRHHVNKKRIFAEFGDQLKIKSQTLLKAWEALFIQAASDRINANIAKDDLRGLNMKFVSVCETEKGLKPRRTKEKCSRMSS